MTNLERLDSQSVRLRPRWTRLVTTMFGSASDNGGRTFVAEVINVTPIDWNKMTKSIIYRILESLCSFVCLKSGRWIGG